MTKYTRAEVAEHNSNNSAWMVIGNKVYDVTKFLEEHPGGCEVLLEKAGEDRTEAFEDIGHSTDAREMKEQFLVGEIVDEEKQKYSYDMRKEKKEDSSSKSSDSFTADSLVYVILFSLIAAILYYLLLS